MEKGREEEMGCIMDEMEGWRGVTVWMSGPCLSFVSVEGEKECRTEWEAANERDAILVLGGGGWGGGGGRFV